MSISEYGSGDHRPTRLDVMDVSRMILCASLHSSVCVVTEQVYDVRRYQ